MKFPRRPLAASLAALLCAPITALAADDLYRFAVE